MLCLLREPNVHDEGRAPLLRASLSIVRCTPGMGVSVGVQVPCRRFTFMSASIHEANYESKARASP